MTATDDVARQLVEAGIALMIESPRLLLDRGLNVEQAFQQSDVSRATFYRRFATKERFLDEVIDALAHNEGLDPNDVRSAVAHVVADSGGDLQRSVRALAHRYSTVVDKADVVPRQLLSILFGRSTAKDRRAIRASYQQRDDAVLDGFESLVGARGVTLQKPFTARSFSALVTAVTDGFLLRREVDPDAVSLDLLADALLALGNAVLNPTHDHGHFYRTIGAVGPAKEPAPIPREPRGALIDAARDEFTRSGYFAATYETIATAAGVPIHTARRLFPTKTHIIAGALKSRYALLSNAIADDVLIELDEVEILKNHFVRCAQLVADETAFMDALMAAVAHDTYSEPDGMLAIKEELNIPALIVPVIDAAQRRGQFATTYAPQELAAMMINTLLLRCFTRRNLSPEENAAFVAAMVLDGMCVR